MQVERFHKKKPIVAVGFQQVDDCEKKTSNQIETSKKCSKMPEVSFWCCQRFWNLCFVMLVLDWTNPPYYTESYPWHHVSVVGTFIFEVGQTVITYILRTHQFEIQIDKRKKEISNPKNNTSNLNPVSITTQVASVEWSTRQATSLCYNWHWQVIRFSSLQPIHHSTNQLTNQLTNIKDYILEHISLVIGYIKTIASTTHYKRTITHKE